MENKEDCKVIVLDENGDVLCFSEDGRITPKPLEEITLDNLFIFWSKDLNELENYFLSLSHWRSTERSVRGILNVNSCSFLDLYIIDQEKGEFLVG